MSEALERIIQEIGAEIALARQQHGKSIEEIAEKTRINPNYLQQIEAGNVDFLPRPYVVAFIKTFARAVGKDGEAMIQKWRDAERSIRAAEQSTLEAQETGDKDKADIPLHESRPEWGEKFTSVSRYYKEIIAGVGIVVIVLIFLYIFSSRRESPTSIPPAKPGSLSEKKIREIPIEEMVAENKERMESLQPALIQDDQKQEAIQQNLRLSLKAVEEVWMKVTIDGFDENEYTFRPGDEHRWVASEYFQLHIGNAGGVRLFLNGKAIGPVGKSGSVVRLTINKDGIQRRRISRPAAAKRANPPGTLTVQAKDSTRH